MDFSVPKTNKEQEEKQKREAGIDLQKGNTNYCQGCSKPLVLCICRKKSGKQEEKEDINEDSKKDEKSLVEDLSQDELASLAQDAQIPAVSYAAIYSDEHIEKLAVGLTSNSSAENLESDSHKVSDTTIFEAASLSKPVFAYIVLKMVQRGEFDLDTPLIEILENKFGKNDPRAQFGPSEPGIRDHKNYGQLTARMILSHQAGLPNYFVGAPGFISNVGVNFDYSGEAFRFLREVIEKVTDTSIEDLAQKEFKRINMNDSSFIRPEHDQVAVGHHADGNVDLRQHFYGIHPAGSLHTTAEDYVIFLKACVQDEFIRTAMFDLEPNVGSLLIKKDTIANKQKVPGEVLDQIGWGVGIGLQKNPNGSLTAFHWGDNSGTCRNFAAINLSTNQAVVCLTNSANGPSLFRRLCEPIVGSLAPVLQWLAIREKLPIDRHPKSAQERAHQETSLENVFDKKLTPAMDLHKNRAGDAGNEAISKSVPGEDLDRMKIKSKK